MSACAAETVANVIGNDIDIEMFEDVCTKVYDKAIPFLEILLAGGSRENYYKLLHSDSHDIGRIAFRYL
jgi:hypothetical protein